MGNIIYRGNDFYTGDLGQLNSFMTGFCQSILSLNPSILTLSSDTGQFQWGTFTSLPPSSTTVPFGWNIFKFDDGYGILFIKFEYFRGYTGYEWLTMRVTIGTGSNGSGVINGLIMDRNFSFPGYQSSVLISDFTKRYYTNRMVCLPGFFAISFIGENKVYDYRISNIFAISRPVNASNEVVTNKLIIYSTSNAMSQTSAVTDDYGRQSFRMVYDLNSLTQVSSDILTDFWTGYELTSLYPINGNGETRYSRVLIRAPEFLIEPNIIYAKKTDLAWDSVIKPSGNGGPVFSEWSCFGNYISKYSNPYNGFVRWE